MKLENVPGVAIIRHDRETCANVLWPHAGTVSPEQLVKSPAKIPHRLMNESGDSFRALVVKAPRPKSETKPV